MDNVDIIFINAEVGEFLASHPWADETKDKYKRVLKRFLVDWPDASDFGLVDFADWLGSQKTWGEQARYIAMYSIKNWLKWKHNDKHPALALKMKRPEEKPQRSLTFDQVYDLLTSFDTWRPCGRRDLAMCALFIDTGLRVSEIAHLQLKYVDVSERLLSVKMKGGKWGTVAFSIYTANYLLAWMGERERVARPGVDRVFVGIGGKTPGYTMTRNGIKCNVRKWGARAGIGPVSPHDFRRTFATLATKNGAPLHVVMNGRWNDARTVRRYTQGITAYDIDRYSPVLNIMNR